MRKIKFFILFIFIASSVFAQTRIKKIDKFLQKRKVENAINTLKQLYPVDSVNKEYYYYMGEINRNAGHYEIAIDYFKKVLNIDSNSAMAINSMGAASAQSGNTSDAIKYVNHAIKLDSANERYYNTRGAIYFVLKEYNLALMDLLKAYKINPKIYNITYNIGISYSRLLDYDNAIYYLTKSIKRQKFRLTYYERGQAYYRADKCKKAIKDYSKALSLKDTENPYENVTAGTLYYWRAQAWKKLGNEAKCQSDIELAKQNGYKQ